MTKIAHRHKINKTIREQGDQLEWSRVYGGDINQAGKFEISGGPVFVKWNQISHFPDMFPAEARGLGLLGTGGSIRVPNVLDQWEDDGMGFLMLEWIEPGNGDLGSWEGFGKALAKLHRNTQDKFGLDHDNYIGKLEQENTLTDSWDEFWVTFRVEPLLKKAFDSGLIPESYLRAANRVFAKAGMLFPKEPPSLVHGDLWGGNILFDQNGNGVVFDPAVYYGHREMDLGMMHLFGGFDDTLLGPYQEEYPLEKGWMDRLLICQLYPMLVHLNLFGSGYASGVKRILDRYD